jgi:hypothetical protein
MGPENRCRLLFARLVTHKYFDPFIMTLIFTSTILMAVDSPLNDPNSTLSNVLNIIDIVITSFFVLESLSKIISNGLIFNGSDSYLRISWNVMDFIIVIFSVSKCFFFSAALTFFFSWYQSFSAALISISSKWFECFESFVLCAWSPEMKA